MKAVRAVRVARTFLPPSWRKRARCASAGGYLAPGPRPILTGIDVNGDGRHEFLFRLDENVTCEGAWSVFSCGSLSCPFTLYEERGSAWRPIGAIEADAPESIALIGTARIDGYLQLRVGCLGGGTCTEYSFYSWVGDHYEHTHMEARGFRVDVARSLHGLYPLVSETALLAAPAADGIVIDRYHGNTEVAIIGTAARGDYYYVSPCNTCERGFVHKSDVLVRQ